MKRKNLFSSSWAQNEIPETRMHISLRLVGTENKPIYDWEIQDTLNSEYCQRQKTTLTQYYLFIKIQDFEDETWRMSLKNTSLLTCREWNMS